MPLPVLWQMVTLPSHVVMVLVAVAVFAVPVMLGITVAVRVMVATTVPDGGTVVLVLVDGTVVLVLVGGTAVAVLVDGTEVLVGGATVGVHAAMTVMVPVMSGW